jgi:hypothetical protein
MRKLRNLGAVLCGILFFCLTTKCLAQSNADASSSSNVILIESYNNYGNGDVYFKISNPTTACSDGYWLTKTDLGFSTNMAILLSAYQAKSIVRIVGFSDQRWSGSAGKFCKLNFITLN